MSAILTALMMLLSQAASLTSSAAMIMQIITTLEQIVPLLIKEYKDVAPFVKNVIAALRSNAGITPEQTKALEDLDAKVDAEFEAAAAAAEAEDKD